MVKQDLFQLFLLALNLKTYVNNASVLKIKKKKQVTQNMTGSL